MTQREPTEEIQKALEGIPIEFHPILRELAFDLGGPDGWPEVIVKLHELVDELKPAIEAYIERIRRKADNET